MREKENKMKVVPYSVLNNTSGFVLKKEPRAWSVSRLTGPADA